jgi:hypothetical membrane protein
MSRRALLIVGGACGPAAVALFIAADLVGSFQLPGYSILSNAISELVETGAPNKAVLDTLLTTYHALVIPFALALHTAVNGGVGSRTGPRLLAFAGAIGIVLTLFFPCDPGCEPFVTFRGTMHIFIAIPMGYSILFGILAFSWRLARDVEWTGYAAYTRLTFAVGVVLATVVVAVAEIEFVGALERLLTAGYLQWFAVMGLVVVCRTMEEYLHDA